VPTIYVNRAFVAAVTMSQVRTIEILLRKSVPDLTKTEVQAEATHRYVAQLPEVTHFHNDASLIGDMMARPARLPGGRFKPDSVREKIRAAQLINRLQAHIFDGLETDRFDVRAAEPRKPADSKVFGSRICDRAHVTGRGVMYRKRWWARPRPEVSALTQGQRRALNKRSENGVARQRKRGWHEYDGIDCGHFLDEPEPGSAASRRTGI
jgi:hypothetical protein